MAKWNKNEDNIGYIVMNEKELISYSGLDYGCSICDSCFSSLADKEDIIFIPILGMAYCNCCGISMMQPSENSRKYYNGNGKEYREFKEEYYRRIFEIAEY